MASISDEVMRAKDLFSVSLTPFPCVLRFSHYTLALLREKD